MTHLLYTTSFFQSIKSISQLFILLSIIGWLTLEESILFIIYNVLPHTNAKAKFVLPHTDAKTKFVLPQ